jgi:rhamnosyltransferase
MRSRFLDQKNMSNNLADRAKAKFFAVVVTFNPNPNVIDNVLALAAQVNLVVVVDNGSEGKNHKHLQVLSSEVNILVIDNDRNLGIGAALNIGVRYGISLGYKWVLTFDQDSRATAGYVQTMHRTYTTIPDNEDVAIICPTYVQEKTGQLFAHRNENPQKSDVSLLNYSAVATTITSGNLMKTELFSKIGFFNEALFIDLVDHEFCLRCRDAKMRIIELHDVVLTHNLGDPVGRSVLGLPLYSSNHSHVRRYYKYRNSVIISRHWFSSDPKFFLNEVKGFLIEPFKILLLERQKLLKLSYILKGISHGIRNIQGELPRH